MELWDHNLVQSILKTERRKLAMIFNNYVCSGKNIYTTSEIDASLEMPSLHRGQKYVISVDKTTEQIVNLAENQHVSVTQDVMFQLLNIILKDAFRETNLK
jgi:hypothetical protein